MSVDVPVGSVRQALAIAEPSSRDTVSITISLERRVSLSQTVACLMGKQLNEAVGQEKILSYVEPGAGSGNLWAVVLATFPVSPEEGEQVHWSVVHG